MIPLLEMRNQIKQKLMLDIPELSIEFAPDDPENYKVTHPKGTILIAYSGRNFSEPVLIQQGVIITFTLHICLRSGFNGDKGLEYIDKARKSMTNDLNFEGNCFWCSNDSVNGEDNGVWYYEQTYVLPSVIYVGE